MAVCTLLDPESKILTIKWTNGKNPVFYLSLQK